MFLHVCFPFITAFHPALYPLGAWTQTRRETNYQPRQTQRTHTHTHTQSPSLRRSTFFVSISELCVCVCVCVCVSRCGYLHPLQDCNYNLTTGPPVELIKSVGHSSWNESEQQQRAATMSRAQGATGYCRSKHKLGRKINWHAAPNHVVLLRRFRVFLPCCSIIPTDLS